MCWSEEDDLKVKKKFTFGKYKGNILWNIVKHEEMLCNEVRELTDFGDRVSASRGYEAAVTARI